MRLIIDKHWCYYANEGSVVIPVCYAVNGSCVFCPWLQYVPLMYCQPFTLFAGAARSHVGRWPQMSWNGCFMVKFACCNYVQHLVATFWGRIFRLPRYSTYSIFFPQLWRCFLALLLHYCYCVLHFPPRGAEFLVERPGSGLFLLYIFCIYIIIEFCLLICFAASYCWWM